MKTTTTSYQVDGNLERKHVNNKNSTIDIVENENKITSLTTDIDQNSQGKKTYETPAIKRWYIYCGLLPKAIYFTKQEIMLAKFCKFITTLNTKCLVLPLMFYLFYGFGFDFSISLTFASIFQIQNLTFENKTRLIMSESIDARELLECEEKCKKLHKMVKKFNISLPKKYIKHFFSVQNIFMLIYPTINLLTNEKFIQNGSYFHRYVGLATLYSIATFFMAFHDCRMVYAPFMKEFPMKNNKIEIENYIEKIHDIVMNCSNNNTTADETLKVLEDNQKRFTYRMHERKKSFFFHPMNVILGLIMTFILIFALIIKERDPNLVFEILSYFLFIAFFNIVVMVIFRQHAIQLAQGAFVFDSKKTILDSLRFMQAVESNLKMSHHYLFEKWLAKQKLLCTVKILGLKVNSDLVKQFITILGSLCSLALAYVARDIIQQNISISV